MILILIIGTVFGLALLFLEIGENGNGNNLTVCRNCIFAPRCDGKNCNKLSVEEARGGDEDEKTKEN